MTLIELMIVVSIIAVLASLAVPAFLKMSCRAKQSEAKVNLRAAMALMESFSAEHENAIVSFGQCNPGNLGPCLGFSPIGSKRYNYQLFATTSFSSDQTPIMVARAFGTSPSDALEVIYSWRWLGTPSCVNMHGITQCESFGDGVISGNSCR